MGVPEVLEDFLQPIRTVLEDVQSCVIFLTGLKIISVHTVGKLRHNVKKENIFTTFIRLFHLAQHLNNEPS